MMEPSLLLGAGLMIVLNAISQAPSTFSRDVKLLNMVVMHEELDPEEDDEAEEDEVRVDTQPVIEGRGTIFFASIIFDRGCPRVSKRCVRELENDLQLPHAYRVFDFPKLRQQFGVLARSVREGRIEKNRHRVPRLVAPTDRVDFLRPPPPEEERVQFNLVEQGVRIRRPLLLHGPDVDENEVVDGDIPDRRNIDEEVQQIWEQLPYDIIRCTPNPKLSDGAYIIMTKLQRRNVDINLFKQVEFEGIFETIQYTVLSEAEWNGKMFDLYFPDRKFNWEPHRQHFKLLEYYRHYHDLLMSLQGDGPARLRNMLRNQWKTVLWVPRATHDRMWDTAIKRGTEYTYVPAHRADNPVRAPIIAINGRIWRYRPLMVGAVRAAGDEEEQEQDGEVEEQ